jgi:hypothetical protein
MIKTLAERFFPGFNLANQFSDIAFDNLSVLAVAGMDRGGRCVL